MLWSGDTDNLQEISDALRGQMSNQDEDEVEDELAAMEREVRGLQKADGSQIKQRLPDVPTMPVNGLPDSPRETPEQRTRRLQRERDLRKANAEPLAA